MSPAFTSKMLRGIVPAMYQVSDDFLTYLETKADKNDVNVKRTLQLCICEILAMIGCGVKPDLMKNPDENVFYQKLLCLMGQKKSLGLTIKIMIVMFCPQLAQLLKLPLIKTETMNFFVNIIKNSIKSRKAEKISKADFIDFFIEMEAGIEKLNTFEDEFESNAKIHLQQEQKFTGQDLEDMVIASALLIFFGGNDTTASSLSVVFYYLAQKQELQDKLYQEIKVKINNYFKEDDQ